MIATLFALARPLLQALDPETAHGLTIRMLGSRLLQRGSAGPEDRRLGVEAFGLVFPNPLGLAAGFDKDAEAMAAMLDLGFGFIEVGTLTPRAQAGNPRPRLFRLVEDRAVINRMGFNNRGYEDARMRLRNRSGIIGVNIGANRDSADRIADYVAGLDAFSPLASYIAVNVSSPNTPGLRELQSCRELDALLGALTKVRKPGGPPLLLKIAPDLSDRELAGLVEIAQARVDGFIVSNTTVARPQLKSRHAGEAGGLSGAPLFDRSTRQLAKVRLLTKGAVPLIGVGGIGGAEAAWAKIGAGASLLQLYSALAFGGPGLIGEILDGLSKRLTLGGYSCLSEAVGRDAERWAYQGLEGT